MKTLPAPGSGTANAAAPGSAQASAAATLASPSGARPLPPEPGRTQAGTGCSNGILLKGETASVLCFPRITVSRGIAVCGQQFEPKPSPWRPQQSPEQAWRSEAKPTTRRGAAPTARPRRTLTQGSLGLKLMCVIKSRSMC